MKHFLIRKENVMMSRKIQKSENSKHCQSYSTNKILIIENKKNRFLREKKRKETLIRK